MIRDLFSIKQQLTLREIRAGLANKYDVAAPSAKISPLLSNMIKRGEIYRPDGGNVYIMPRNDMLLESILRDLEAWYKYADQQDIEGREDDIIAAIQSLDNALKGEN